MAVQNNGQPLGPISFTDEYAGKRVFIGANQPTNPTDGDIWIDSDTQNNAGKNLISSTSLTGSTVNISVTSAYKDLYIVFRGVRPSATANLTMTLNSNSTNYQTGTSLFSIANLSSSATTNHWALEIVDVTDSTSFAWATLQGVYTNSSSAVTMISSSNAFTLAAAITTLTLSLSTGTFSGGTALVYGVN